MNYAMKSLGLVFQAIQSERGYASVAMSSAEMLRCTHLINQAGRYAWRLRIWPDFTEVEKRTYRPPWDVAQQYNTGNQVWRINSDGVTGHYYQALSNTIGVDPQDGNQSAIWLQDPPEMRLYIEYNQPWESVPMDGVELDKFASWQDPSYVKNPAYVQGLWIYQQTVVFPAMSQGLDQGQFTPSGVARGMPAQPWVRFRPPWPVVSAVPWDIGESVAAGTLRYYTSAGATYGDCYIALVPNTGQQPDTSPDWAIRGVPEFFARYIELFALSQRQSEDEGKYKTLQMATEELAQLEDIAMTNTGMAVGATFFGR